MKEVDLGPIHIVIFIFGLFLVIYGVFGCTSTTNNLNMNCRWTEETDCTYFHTPWMRGPNMPNSCERNYVCR